MEMLQLFCDQEDTELGRGERCKEGRLLRTLLVNAISQLESPPSPPLEFQLCEIITLFVV